eukprot:TRINITY_DN25044_c0_g5_i1.p1 TRINITY_DN25044_c0_g5~~TRINITY_DN25044_c0_g5_i1.p1  ORF type:complete len:1874 (+),score=257.16 TRINITY_DN25044_c0_g5_i1:49-5670(+)
MSSSTGLVSKFNAVLAELNFGVRCKRLAALGRELAAAGLTQSQLESSLDQLIPETSSSFEELARIEVARGARAIGYVMRMLDHPSQAVRRAALDSGLLTVQQAKELFLSTSSSCQMKQWLLRSSSLQCDEEVLSEALQLFGPGAACIILCRTKDDKQFEAWVKQLGGHIRSKPLPNMLWLARRFPVQIIKMLQSGALKGHHLKWDTLAELTKRHPDMMLPSVFLEGTPMHFPLHYFDDRLASYGWRHAPEVMRDICRRLVNATGKWTAVTLAKALPSISCNSMYMTPVMKLKEIVAVFSQMPTSSKTPAMAAEFVALLPKLEAHRDREIQIVVASFWSILSELGRIQRNDALQWNSMQLFRMFAKLLPPALAVEQFSKLLDEVKAPHDVYRFMQSDICKSEEGVHDDSMKQVFEWYVKKDGETAVQVVKMFDVLLKDCVSQNVLQEAFDILTWRLGNITELSLLLRTVRKMATLERVAKDGSSEGLGLPCHWLRFVEIPQDVASSHIRYLHLTLHSGIEDGSLLSAMVGRFGRIFFWDALREVLVALSEASCSTILNASPAPDLSMFRSVKLANLGSARGGKWHDTQQCAPGHPQSPSLYFDKLADMKNDNFGRDPDKRQQGYVALIEAASKELEPEKAFSDLLPFLVKRITGEQDNIKAVVMEQLFDQMALPFKLWSVNLPDLQALFKASTKNLNVEFEGPRHTQQSTWKRVAERLLKDAFVTWGDAESPSELCEFGWSCLCLIEKKSSTALPNLFVAACSQAKRTVSNMASKWVVEATLSAIKDQSVKLHAFWETLETMVKGISQLERQIDEKAKPSVRDLWQRWPFVPLMWSELLSGSVTQSAAQYVAVDFIQKMVDFQATCAVWDNQAGRYVHWWAPIEAPAYIAAVQNLLRQIGARDIPAADAARILVQRILIVVAKERMVRVGTFDAESLSCPNRDVRCWYKAKPEPRQGRLEDKDANVGLELNTLSELLESGLDRRQVLWQIAGVASCVSGPKMGLLLQQAISCVDAEFEGMARCISRQYPFLNAALCRGQVGDLGSSDLLTPLVDAWLGEDVVRDARVEILMQRDDCHYLLFFGAKFVEHLSNRRQEWLHECLKRIHAPTEGPIEFYHFTERGPSLSRVALMGKGWRSVDGLHNPSLGNLRCVQTSMWHRDTQAEFLLKALYSTDLSVLGLLPRLDYVGGIKRCADLLAVVPRAQQGPIPDDGWTVVQPTGSCDDLVAEVKRRFAEGAVHGSRNEVGESEKEQILTVLGFADSAIEALPILAEYAEQNAKRAKDAVSKAVLKLSPTQARILVRDVMLGPKAGASLRTRAVGLVAELKMSNPLELYRVAWNNGECNVDVAATILSRVATLPPVDWSPDDVRPFFDFFTNGKRTKDVPTVAKSLFENLRASWTLPFLPSVMVTLALLPDQTRRAMHALKTASGLDTEIVLAFADLLENVRVAARVKTIATTKNTSEGDTLKQLGSLTDDASLLDPVRVRAVTCSPEALLRVVDQVKLSCNDACNAKWASEEIVLGLWVKLLREDDNGTRWSTVILEMERWCVSRSRLGIFEDLTLIVGSRLKAMSLVGERRATMLGIANELFVRVCDVHLKTFEVSQIGQRAEAARVKPIDETVSRKHRILTKHWPTLLASGCGPDDTNELFARCPTDLRGDVTEAVVTWSLAGKCPCDIGFRALSWLATEATDTERRKFIDLGARLIAVSFANSPSIDQVLSCISPLRPDELTALVDKVIDCKPLKSVARDALRKLTRVSALDAVRIYPRILDLKESESDELKPHEGDADDIEALLDLCALNGLEFPLVDPRSCPVSAIDRLAKSARPTARALAVQIIQERDLAEAAADVLKTLCLDPSPIVRFAAQHLQKVLGIE